MWVPACDILSLHFSALPSHHKTQQETGSLPLPTLFLHEFFLLLIAHIFPLSYSKFQIFFLSYPQTENHIYNGKLKTHHCQHH